MRVVYYIFFIFIYIISAAAITCDDYSKDESKCLAASEDNVNCAFCKSAAVGTLCAKETDAKSLPSSVFQCEFSRSYNETGYNPSAAVDFANEYCAKDSEWLCAEFVAHALHHAGLFSGVTDYGNYKGYNLRMVTDLHKALKTLYGWYESSSGTVFIIIIILLLLLSLLLLFYHCYYH